MISRRGGAPQLHANGCCRMATAGMQVSTSRGHMSSCCCGCGKRVIYACIVCSAAPQDQSRLSRIDSGWETREELFTLRGPKRKVVKNLAQTLAARGQAKQRFFGCVRQPRALHTIKAKWRRETRQCWWAYRSTEGCEASVCRLCGTLGWVRIGEDLGRCGGEVGPDLID